jgi:hypothetical protein
MTKGQQPLIYGVDIKQQIHFYDVSDKLDDKKYSRFRKMDIDEFNERRLFSLASGFGRSLVFYRKLK